MPAQDTSQPLVWIDMEMSGLDVERERILEIATILTDDSLRVIATGPNLVVHQPDEVLAAMDNWNRTHHGESGLIDRVRASKVTEREAEEETLRFIEDYCEPGLCPLAGNSVWQDRRFLAKYMPRLDAFLHYRIIDVSTIKELARRWYPDRLREATPKVSSHRAMDDIRESIQELRFYRRRIFMP
jgi:oligoribonuclease